jgi:putative nucleotidyltransferase with HDIG domain
MDAATERRIEASLERRERTLDRRELLGALVLSSGFLVCAIALAQLGTSPRAFSAPVALAFVVAYAVAARIEFSAGTGYAVPTQLVLVPMLLLLPTPLVPLLVAAAYAGSELWNTRKLGVAPSRLLYSPADAMFALGPALVLVLGDAQTPAWEHLPVYVLALAAQFAVETVVFGVRGSLLHDMRLGEVLGELRLGQRVDALLAPIGLLAAIAGAGTPVAALFVLALIPLLRGFEREREGRIQHSLELGRAYRGTALLLRDLLEEDDEYTGHHTEDVVDLSVRVAEQLGVSEDVKRETELGALLHDIGKIHIPDAIINKAGPLDDDEWALMKTHTVEGQKMLDQVGGLLSNVGLVVRASHERFDGRGYPDGLAGEEIPLAARIVAVCDSFNAMTTTRSYRPGMPVATAADEVRRCAGSQFDPAVADALLAVIGDPGWQLTMREPAPAPAVPVRA